MPNRRLSDRSVIGAAAAIVLSLAGCDRPAETATPAPVAIPNAQPQIAPPAPPAALDRVGLLHAMDEAAAAYAADERTAPGPANLSGRRFLVRQAFGCFSAAEPEPASDDGLARWRWKDEREAIELTLSPGDWTKSALVAGAGPNWEAVEGLWLTRPWLRGEGCPGARQDPLASGPPAPSPQTMGLAAVFEAGGSRLGRRNGRDYVATIRGKDGEALSSPKGGYRLVLEGRLVSFADGQAVHCRADSPDQRPVCVAATRLDRVAFEDAAGEVISEWRPA